MSAFPLVLMYHSIEPYTSDPYQVTVSPARFERQMTWLRRRGLRGVSMRTLLDDPRPGQVGLTFDDGYADFVTEVMPVLARHDFTATVYVVAGALGGHNSWDTPGPRKELMTASDIAAVASDGVEIGSHGYLHVRLPAESSLDDHVVRSRKILADLSGQDVTGFCYPWGEVGAREVEAVRSAGYDYACAVRPTPVIGRHALPRTFIGDRDATHRLYAKVARHRLTVGRAA